MGNLFILISIAFNVTGQAVLKFGVNQLGGLSMDLPSMFKAFTNLFVWGGIAAYGFSTIFWILALSNKDLSYAYPMLSIGYLVILFVSWFILGETVNAYRIIGVVLITAGIFFVFKS